MLLSPVSTHRTDETPRCGLLVADVLCRYGLPTAVTGPEPVYEISDVAQGDIAHAISRSIRSGFPDTMIAAYETMSSLRAKVELWITSGLPQ